MSQKVTRKGAIGEEKEKDKRQTDSPAKDIKKKMANSEKDKQIPTEKPEKSDKQLEKKQEKPIEKDKKEQKDKKETEKKDSPQEKKEDSKTEKSGKPDKDKAKENGNGVRNGTETPTNGALDANGTVSDTDDEALVIDDDHEVFPELAYDDSDIEGFEGFEGFERPTPENLPSRSYTRRSQVKSSRTPETPRPASEKQTERDINEDPKDTKVLKLKDDTSSDRKLRSSDSPKPQDKKTQEVNKDSPKNDTEEKKIEQNAEKDETQTVEVEKKNEEVIDVDAEKPVEKTDKLEVEVVVEIEADEEPRKLDTNYSKSRVKVSPYRRSTRLADQTASSLMANYTGNNTTMETDITESSFVTIGEEESLNDSSYLRGLRSIRGRNSYKPLKEITLKHVTANRTNRPNIQSTTTTEYRPTAPVVGRKRKPEPEPDSPPHDKRLRLLDRIAAPFRRTHTLTLPRRTPEIVGINTDLPLTVPVATPDTFDPESLKPDPVPVLDTEPIATPLKHEERDSKRCHIM